MRQRAEEIRSTRARAHTYITHTQTLARAVNLSRPNKTASLSLSECELKLVVTQHVSGAAERLFVAASGEMNKYDNNNNNNGAIFRTTD